MSDAPETTPWWALRYEAMAALDPALLGAVDDRAEAEVAFFGALTGLTAARVLDVGAGAGRHSVLLAEAGHQVTAIDLSPRLLRIARERWEARNPGERGPTWMPGDMRWPPEGGAVDAALVIDAFGFFDDEADHARVLAAIAQHLRPGGQLVMCVGNPYHWAAEARVQHAGPGSIAEALDVVRSWRFEARSGRLEERSVVFGRGQRHEPPPSSVRLFTPMELEALVRGAGFSEVELYGTEGFAVPEEPVPLHPTDSVAIWVHARL